MGGPMRRDVLLAGIGMAASCAVPKAFASELVAETAQGKVRGRAHDGVQVFKGLRYGASTAGENRFRPPQPPAKWAGVQDAFDYGDQAPQMRGPLAAAGPMSEDCLRINIWTPGLDQKKRPVMLWFHGGGFEAGSGSSPLYDGTNLARRGDVVVATINHRLNVFGHCFFGDLIDEGFEGSGNVGYLDLIAAMKWVRTNIAAFGGDPDNVSIFGQSGGGRKVSLCYAGRDAQGLFQRGVVQSGSHLRIQTPDQAQALTLQLLEALQIPRDQARRLQQVPQEALTSAQLSVIKKANYRFSPVLDGVAFQEHPFLPNAPRISNHLPMMLGTTRTELSNQLGRLPGVFELDQAGLRARLANFLPADDVETAIAVFQQSRPTASPSELFFTITSARGYVLDQTIMAEQRVKASAAPSFVYQLMWRSPAEGGRRISQHTLDLPFVFDNVARAERLTGPATRETAALADAMSESWLAFARTGDPNNGKIPAWRPYDLDRREVMLFDVPSQAVDDPHRAERLFMARYPSQQMGRTLHRQDL